jgi:hypothetical protein
VIDETTATEAEPAPEQTSRWEDYVDVFFSPAELFRRRAHDRVMPPLVTLLLLAIAFYFILLPANTMIMRASMAEAGPEGAEMVERFASMLQIVGGIFVPIMYMIMLTITAALLLVGGRIAEIRTDFNRMLLVATYAGFVYLVAQIAGAVAVLLQGEVGLDVVRHMSFGPLRFTGDTDNAVLTAILRRFEIFAIWQAILWGIGISVIYRVSRARGLAVAFAVWALFTLPAVFMALLGLGRGPTAG